MDYQKDHFPVLSIQAFSQGRSADCTVLFNELHGERSIDEAHKHDFFIVILFERGKGSHTIDFVEHTIADFQLHMVFPEQVHQWEIEQETVGYQLMIGRERFETFLPYLRFSAAFYQHHPVIDLSREAFNTLLYEFQSVKRELETPAIFWELIQARCSSIGLLVSRVAENIFKDLDIYNSNAILPRFISLTDRYFKTQRSVAFYASEIGISPNYLNMVCKKQLNVSASSLIQNRVLLEAKRLLKASEMTVKEIVFDLGFYDHANFSKFFKSHTGMTPSEFRELK